MNATLTNWKHHLILANVQLSNAKRQNQFKEVARLEGFKDALEMCIEQIESLNPQPSFDDHIVSGLQSGMDFILNRR